MRPFEHYLIAEELLEHAHDRGRNEQEARDLVAEAQVHATLALVVEGGGPNSASQHRFSGRTTAAF